MKRTFLSNLVLETNSLTTNLASRCIGIQLGPSARYNSETANEVCPSGMTQTGTFEGLIACWTGTGRALHV